MRKGRRLHPGPSTRETRSKGREKSQACERANRAIPVSCTFISSSSMTHGLVSLYQGAPNCWLVVAGRTGVQRGPSFRFLHSVMSDVYRAPSPRASAFACLLACLASEHCSSAVRQLLYTLRGFGMLLRLRKRKTAMPPSICDSDPRAWGSGDHARALC